MDATRDDEPHKSTKEDSTIVMRTESPEVEREPEASYTLGLKTWLAVLALAFATSCAVVSTTVCPWT